MSNSGLHTLGALYYQNYSFEDEWEALRNEHITLLLENADLCKDQDEAEDEILYGNAGYLYCLLWLLKDLTFSSEESELLQRRLLETVEDVAMNLFHVGAKIGEKADALLYTFPRRGGKFYLGGAHGTIGILYMLLLAADASPTLSGNADYMDMINKSCKFIVDLQFESGNFPSSYGNKADKLLHFCHGAPGAIPLLVKAYGVYQDDAFLNSALKAGEIIWDRGILLKGSGLCHGISGNAYMLHALFRAIKDPKWKHRAIMFAFATCDEEVQKQIHEYADSARMEVGVPDTPYSLMEGLAGNTVMLVDIIKSDLSEPKFPGYEIQ